MKAILFSCCMLVASLTCVSQGNAPNTYPFSIQNNSSRFIIVAEIESKELYPKYFNLFQKYGYTGNGQCWSDMIVQLLKKKAPALLGHLEFDPEAGAFLAYAKSNTDQQEFIKQVVPVFSNLKKLEGFIKTVDRNQIDD